MGLFGWGGYATSLPDDRGPRAASPENEYVAGGWPAGFSTDCVYDGRAPVRQALARYGPTLWDMMGVDDKVGGSLGTFVEAIMADGIQVAPVVVGEDEAPGDQKGARASYKKATREARRWADFCRRAFDAMGDVSDDPHAQSIEDVVDQLCHGGIQHGAMLAEKVYHRTDLGPEKNVLTFRTVDVKPRTAWQFTVDKLGKVSGIAANTRRGVRRLPRDKFAIWQYLPRNGDPNGTFGLEGAYLAWNCKQQLIPAYHKYLNRFAEPSLVAVAGKDAQNTNAVDDNGQPIVGKILTPVQQLYNALLKFKNGSAIALPPGASLEALEAQGEGQAFLGAFDLFDRYIVFAILHQTRATMEASHGSRADSETAQDILGLVARKARYAVARMIRNDLCRHLIRLNAGAEVARLYTPQVSLGNVEYSDLAPMANAIAKLAESGYLAESQLPSLDKLLRLPIRTPDSPRLTAKPAEQGGQGAAGAPKPKTPAKPKPKAGAKP